MFQKGNICFGSPRCTLPYSACNHSARGDTAFMSSNYPVELLLAPCQINHVTHLATQNFHKGAKYPGRRLKTQRRGERGRLKPLLPIHKQKVVAVHLRDMKLSLLVSHSSSISKHKGYSWSSEALIR